MFLCDLPTFCRTLRLNLALPLSRKCHASFPLMGHTFIVADDVMIFGSTNFTQARDKRNSENFNVLHGPGCAPRRMCQVGPVVELSAQAIRTNRDKDGFP